MIRVLRRGLEQMIADIDSDNCTMTEDDIERAIPREPRSL